MITRENYKDVLTMLNTKQLSRIKNTDKQYIVLELHTFNAGSTVVIKLTDNFNRYKNVSDHGNCIFEVDQVQNDLQEFILKNN